VEIAVDLRLFLDNVESKMLSGPFVAGGVGGTYQEGAWRGEFPCQFRLGTGAGSLELVRTVQVPPGTRGLNSGPLSFQRHYWLLALLQQEQNGCGEDERPETGFLVKQHLLPSLADD